MTIPKILVSSVDPQKVSLTVKGFILAALPVVITIAGLTHLNLGQQEITGLANGIIDFIASMASLASAAMIVYGLARKMLVEIGAIKPAV